MRYLDVTRINGGGIGRYIEEICKSNIYDYYIGDEEIIYKFFPKERCISKKIISDVAFKKTDIIHFPANSMMDLPEISDVSAIKILTIHDIIPIKCNEFYKVNKQKYIKDIKLSIDKCSYIFTVSNCSKNDIVSYFNILPEKVIVIYNGVNANFGKKNIMRESVLKKFNIVNRKFNLMISASRLKHKNFYRSVMAFIVSKTHKDSNLIIYGSCNNIFKLLNYVIGILHIRYIGRISDYELDRIYNVSDLMLYMSFYEGFGLPPLESLKCGTAVLTSKLSSIPEILGDSVYYANPYSIKEIANTIDSILSQKNISELVMIQCAEKYSWDNTRKGISCFFKKIESSNRY